MKIYAVTINGEPCNLVGIFQAHDLSELALCVDEICNVEDTVYAEIKEAGGITWASNNHQPIDEHEELPEPTLAGSWADVAIYVMGGGNLDWKKLSPQRRGKTR